MSWPLGNYLGLIWFPKPFNWGLFGLVAGTFGFAFIEPRIDTSKLLQLYEMNTNDVTMAIIIFTCLADVSVS